MSEWTLDSLKAHLEAQIKADRELSDERFYQADKALAVAAKEQSRRLEVLNHAHENATKIQQTYLPRETYEKQHGPLVQKVENLATWQARLGGGILIIAFLVSANFVKVWVG